MTYITEDEKENDLYITKKEKEMYDKPSGVFLWYNILIRPMTGKEYDSLSTSYLPTLTVGLSL